MNAGDAVLAASSNPERTATALERLAERLPDRREQLDAEGLRRVAVVSGASEALGDFVSTSPVALDILTGELAPADAAMVRRRCEEAIDGADNVAAALALEQRRGLLRVAARDLLGLARLPEVTAELADLAEGVLGAALGRVTADMDGTLLVVAMGKLGGRELNYVSDVDIIFVGEGEWAETSRTAERFLRLLGEVTPEGRAYEVDANLRPEGKDGPLVRSLEAYESYYERWAKTWEFQALLKARPVAGDEGLAVDFRALADRFVWPDRLDPAAVPEIQKMKGVVEESREVRRAGARQVKLAPGGLRDIEFSVQLLQMVHGRHDPALRTPNTLEGLAALSDRAYVGREDAQAFGQAYEFLRTVEHRLQLVRLRRTHTLPEDPDDRRRLARTMGFGGADPLEAFDAELRRVQALTRELHGKLFYRPLLARFAQLGEAERLPVSVVAGTETAGRLGEESARDRLEALGFRHPADALRHLEALASGVSRRARMFQTVLPAVLPTLAASPDPDGGLASLRSLAERLSESPFLLRTLRDNPPVADLLSVVLGTSRVVGSWLERQPEVLGVLAESATLAQRLTAEDYRRRVDATRRRAESAEDMADSLRRLRRREVARIAVRDVAGLGDVLDVASELSGVAEACLQAAVDQVLAGQGGDNDLTLAVVGMGKLGGSELGYASDLDVLLVFEPADAREAAEEAAAELLRLLSGVTPEGTVFRVDPNLRPEGKDGPLVRTLTSYRQYYERWGEPWELQALTQARHVAGDRALGRSFVSSMADLVYPSRLSASRVQAMRQMKARVERERGTAKPSKVRPGRPRGGVATGAQTDVKLGPGGLSDVDWTAQMLQLQRGGKTPALRRPGTVATLQACVVAQVLDPQDGAWLEEGWRFLARIRNALYLAGERETSHVPTDPAKMERLARMLGYERPGAQTFTEDLARTMRRVRKVHERIFYGT